MKHKMKDYKMTDLVLTDKAFAAIDAIAGQITDICVLEMDTTGTDMNGLVVHTNANQYILHSWAICKNTGEARLFHGTYKRHDGSLADTCRAMNECLNKYHAKRKA